MFYYYLLLCIAFIHEGALVVPELGAVVGAVQPWLRTNGVNTNGAAAKVTMFDRSGKKVRPGTFGKITVG